jgi:hypothetical protein
VIDSFNLYKDIIFGTIIYLILAFFSIKKTPIENRKLFIYQLLLLFFLLFIIHIYAYFNLKTFPALGEDSLFYDKLANYLSKSIRSGEFDIGFENYFGFSPDYYRVQRYTNIGTHIPYGFVFPLSIVYTVFGYAPFIAKVFNVFAFHFAAKVFYKILIHNNIHGFALKRTLIFFAFFPPLMASSFSFVKESLLMLAFLSLILNLQEGKLIRSLPWLILAVLIRPYTPLIFVLVYVIFYRRQFLKRFGRYALVLSILFVVFSFISFSAFDLGRFLFESNYTILYDYSDTTRSIQASGVLELFSILTSSPLMFLEYFFYGWFIAIFKPEPWRFEIANMFFGKDYINAGSFNISYLAYYLYSVILYILHFTFIKYILNRSLYKGIKINFELFLIFILVTSIIFLRAVELRYLIMSVYPFVLLLYGKIKSFPVMIPNYNTYIFYSFMVGGLFLVPIIF